MKTKLMLFLSFIALMLTLTGCSIFQSHEHQFSETLVEPTCTSQGYTLKKCQCGYELKVNVVPAKEHSYAETFTVDQEASCTEAGVKSRHCNTCDAKIDETEIVPLGHDYANVWTVDVPAQCESAGSESRHCSRCNDPTDERPIAKLGHDYAKSYTVDKEATCTAAGQKSRHCSRCDSKIDVTNISKYTLYMKI